MTDEQLNHALEIAFEVAEAGLKELHFRTTPQLVMDPMKFNKEEFLKEHASLLRSAWGQVGKEEEPEIPTLTPTHYAERERGPILPWHFGPIKYNQLDYRDNLYVMLTLRNKLIQVHSLFFGEPNGDLFSFGRWDCVNGWTLEPKKEPNNV